MLIIKFLFIFRSRNTVIKEPINVNVAENQLVFNIVGGYDYQRLFWSLPPAFTGNKVFLAFFYISLNLLHFLKCL